MFGVEIKQIAALKGQRVGRRESKRDGPPLCIGLAGAMSKPLSNSCPEALVWLRG